MFRRPPRWLQAYQRSFLGRWGEFVIAVLVMAAFPLFIAGSNFAMTLHERALWNAPGPPCPSATTLLRNRPDHPPRTFRFRELTVTRLAGDVECRAIGS